MENITNNLESTLFIQLFYQLTYVKLLSFNIFVNDLHLVFNSSIPIVFVDDTNLIFKDKEANSKDLVKHLRKTFGKSLLIV